MSTTLTTEKNGKFTMIPLKFRGQTFLGTVQFAQGTRVAIIMPGTPKERRANLIVLLEGQEFKPGRMTTITDLTDGNRSLNAPAGQQTLSALYFDGGKAFWGGTVRPAREKVLHVAANIMNALAGIAHKTGPSGQGGI